MGNSISCSLEFCYGIEENEEIDSNMDENEINPIITNKEKEIQPVKHTIRSLASTVPLIKNVILPPLAEFYDSCMHISVNISNLSEITKLKLSIDDTISCVELSGVLLTSSGSSSENILRESFMQFGSCVGNSANFINELRDKILHQSHSNFQNLNLMIDKVDKEKLKNLKNRIKKAKTAVITAISLLCELNFKTQISSEGMKEIKNLLNPLSLGFSLNFNPVCHMTLHAKSKHWLHQIILNWINGKSTERVFWLQGEDGMGKSVFSRSLVTRLLINQKLLGACFIQFNNEDTKNPKNIIKTLAFHIARNFPETRDSILRTLKTMDFPYNECVFPVDELFNELVLKPLYLVEIDDPRFNMIIVLDSIDETENKVIMENLVFMILRMAPNWVKLFFTSRENGVLENKLMKFHFIRIRDNDFRHFDDFQSFIRDIVKPKFTIDKIPKLVNVLTTKSENNFLTLSLIEEQFKSPDFQYDLGYIEKEISTGFDENMRKLFKQWFGGVSGKFEKFKKLLEFLLVTYEPCPFLLAYSLMEISLIEFEEIVESLKFLFAIEGEGEFRKFHIIHKNFSNWMFDKSRNGDFFIDYDEANENFTDALLLEFKKEEKLEIIDKYIASHLLKHLDKSEYYSDSLIVLFDLKWLHLSIRHGNIGFLINELVFRFSEISHYSPESKEIIKFLCQCIKLSKFAFYDKKYQNFETEFCTQVLGRLNGINEIHPLLNNLKNQCESYLNQVPSYKVLNLGFENPNMGCEWVLTGHTGWVICSCVVSEKKLVTAGKDNNIIIWDLITGQRFKTIYIPDSEVSSICSFNSENIICGFENGFIKVFNISTGEEIWEFTTNEEGFSVFDTAASSIFSAGLISWNNEENNENNGNSIYNLLKVEDNFLVSTSKNECIFVWKLRNFNRILNSQESFEKDKTELNSILKGHTGMVLNVCYMGNNLIASCSKDGTIKTWNLTSEECLKTINQRSKWIYFDFSNNSLITASEYNIKIYSILNFKVKKTIDIKPLRCFVPLENGKFAVSSTNNLQILDENGFLETDFKGHSNTINHISLSIGENRILTSSRDNNVRIWCKKPEKTNLTHNSFHEGAITCFCAIDKFSFVSGSQDKTIKYWTYTNNEFICQTFKGHKQAINCICYFPKQWIISGSDDGTLRVWNIISGECDNILENFAVKTNFVVSVPNNNWFTWNMVNKVISASSDGVLRVWNINKGNCILEMKNEKECKFLDLILTNENFVSCLSENTNKTEKMVSLWDFNSGSPIWEVSIEGFSLFHFEDKFIFCENKVINVLNGKILKSLPSKEMVYLLQNQHVALLKDNEKICSFDLQEYKIITEFENLNEIIGLIQNSTNEKQNNSFFKSQDFPDFPVFLDQQVENFLILKDFIVVGGFNGMICVLSKNSF